MAINSFIVVILCTSPIVTTLGVKVVIAVMGVTVVITVLGVSHSHHHCVPPGHQDHPPDKASHLLWLHQLSFSPC